MTHPQQLINKQSLIGEQASSTLNHAQSIIQGKPLKPLGNLDAQTFWLNAAKRIDWFKEPSVAYAQLEGDIVSTLSAFEECGEIP